MGVFHRLAAQTGVYLIHIGAFCVDGTLFVA